MWRRFTLGQTCTAQSTETFPPPVRKPARRPGNELSKLWKKNISGRSKARNQNWNQNVATATHVKRKLRLSRPRNSRLAPLNLARQSHPAGRIPISHMRSTPSMKILLLLSVA